MSGPKDISLRPMGPGDKEKLHAVVKDAMSEGPFHWIPLGLTRTQWIEKLNGMPIEEVYKLKIEERKWPLEQDVLVHYAEKGVYVTGLCGNFYWGKRMPDGTVDTSKADFLNTNTGDDVIIEYADPPGFKLRRDGDGALIFPPGWGDDF